MQKQKQKIRSTRASGALVLLMIVVAMFAIQPAHAALFSALSDTPLSLSVAGGGGIPPGWTKHTFFATLPAGLNFDAAGGSDVFLVDFPATFTVGNVWSVADFTFNDGIERTIDGVAQGAGLSTIFCTNGANNVGIAIDTTDLIFRVIPCGAAFVSSADGAQIRFSIDGANPDGVLSNPAAPGNTQIGISVKDEGSLGAVAGTVTLPIVALASDQATVTASVDPSISFNAGVQVTASACDSTFSTDGGNVDLGTISRSTVVSSDTDGRSHICTRLSTNATTGAVVSVKSTNASLKSTATPVDSVPSATATPLAGATAGYGLCVGSHGIDTGAGVTVPVSAAPIRVAPFNGICSSTEHNIGGLTGATQTLWSTAGATSNAFARVYVKAAASGTTEGHDDYSDTLTIIASGIF